MGSTVEDFILCNVEWCFTAALCTPAVVSIHCATAQPYLQYTHKGSVYRAKQNYAGVDCEPAA